MHGAGGQGPFAECVLFYEELVPNADGGLIIPLQTCSKVVVKFLNSCDNQEN
jgi:hypothetical protein